MLIRLRSAFAYLALIAAVLSLLPGMTQLGAVAVALAVSLGWREMRGVPKVVFSVALIALARRFQGNWWLMLGMLAVSGLAAWATWQSITDIFPVMAMAFGTVGMFMLRGIPLRVVLGLAAFSWMLNNIVIGSIGGILAEGMVLVTNGITIVRLYRLRRKFPDIIE